MNDNFNISRFGLLIKQHIANTWRYYVRQSTVMGLAIALVECIAIWNMRDGFDSLAVRDNYAGTIHAILAMAMIVLIPLSAAMLMNNMKTKQQRISFLVLPASNLEKFILRILHSSVGYLACFVVGTIIAEIIQLIFSILVTQHTTFVAPDLYGGILTGMFNLAEEISVELATKGTLPFDPSIAKLATMCYLGFVIMHATYTLGGAVFRKHALVFTSLCVMAWSMLRFMLLAMLPINPMDFFTVGHDGLFIGYVIYNTILVIAFYVGAYCIFKRSQGINNSLINL